MTKGSTRKNSGRTGRSSAWMRWMSANRAALGGVELALGGVERLVHVGIRVARVVLAAPAVLGRGDFLRMQGRTRHAFGLLDPGIHGKPGELPPVQGFREDARRFGLDAHLDADLLQLALDHLRHQLAHAIAGRGRDLDRQALALGILAHAVLDLGEARLVQELARRRRIVGVVARHGAVHRVERADRAVGDRLLALEQLVGDRLAVDRHQDRLAHARGRPAACCRAWCRCARRSAPACR